MLGKGLTVIPHRKPLLRINRTAYGFYFAGGAGVKYCELIWTTHSVCGASVGPKRELEVSADTKLRGKEFVRWYDSELVRSAFVGLMMTLICRAVE